MSKVRSSGEMTFSHMIHDHMTFKMAVMPCKEVIVVLFTLVFTSAYVCSANHVVIQFIDVNLLQISNS